MKQVHIFISGFVQGVGFRQFIKQNARRLGVTGRVRNTQDGKVETIMQGSQENLDEMVELCKKGPFLAEVEDVQVEWEEASEKHSSFDTTF